jgi:hypothetical protein
MMVVIVAVCVAAGLPLCVKVSQGRTGRVVNRGVTNPAPCQAAPWRCLGRQGLVVVVVPGDDGCMVDAINLTADC